MNEPIALLNPSMNTALKAADHACRAIPPAWPLAATVAVNPFLGQSQEDLAQAGARLARVAGAPVTMPRSWYAEKIAAGEIMDDDIAAAIEAAGRPGLTVEQVKAAGRAPLPEPTAAPTIAELAARETGVDWPAIVADRFSAWASGYFDEGQALWTAPQSRAPWAAWRAFATHDLTPEILGLEGFAAEADDASDQLALFIASTADSLGLTSDEMPSYFHRLLITLGGWSQLARYRLWTAEQSGGADQTLLACLAIRLFWERALYARGDERLKAAWRAARRTYAEPLVPSDALRVDALLQEASERAAQRMLASRLSEDAPNASADRPSVQAAFCIDVRSEVFRRALEACDPSIQTLGFAGFFGLGVSHRSFASDVEELRLPVLLQPGLNTCSHGHDHGHDASHHGADSEQTARIEARATRAWGRFKLAAVSSFAFVESAGPLYIGKLVRDALGLSPATSWASPAPRLDPSVTLDARIDAAEAILRAMSLTDGFARLVILAGHGASVVNNPHASALQCGACGGYSGEVNARLLAGLLNEAAVREGLVGRGIVIPTDTLFVGGLHDTTTDQVTLYTEDAPTTHHTKDLSRAAAWLEAAGRICRGERVGRLPRAEDEADLPRRSRDWAEVRPEWALAGCRAFIAAPRSRTAGKSLKGQAFLHSYDWRADEEFKVLELIITAPVVVASWISLQYYGSCVAPDTFGAGNKLLHNVVGGVGVFEGNGGALRAGLSWQSVHDGEAFTHDPLRLSVCIEAPREAIADILRRHEGVRALFDNGWLHLFALDDEGRMAWRYRPGLKWDRVDAATPGGAALKAAS